MDIMRDAHLQFVPHGPPLKVIPSQVTPWVENNTSYGNNLRYSNANDINGGRWGRNNVNITISTNIMLYVEIMVETDSTTKIIEIMSTCKKCFTTVVQCMGKMVATTVVITLKVITILYFDQPNMRLVASHLQGILRWCVVDCFPKWK